MTIAIIMIHRRETKHPLAHSLGNGNSNKKDEKRVEKREEKIGNAHESTFFLYYRYCRVW